MSAKKNDGGAAFPIPDRTIKPHTGMSLRDWYKGQALTSTNLGLHANYRLTPAQAETIAKNCGLIADAMLAEKFKRES